MIYFTGEADATLECRLDAGTWTPCLGSYDYALEDGQHTFDVTATDLAGNTSATTSATWMVDAVPPTIGTTFPAASNVYNNTKYTAGCDTGSTGDICGAASDPGGALSTVEISLKSEDTQLWLTGGAFTAENPDWITADGTTSWSYALDAVKYPADASYLVWVRATDAVGNVTYAYSWFGIDRTAPDAPTTVGPAGAMGFTTFDVIAEADATFECALDGAWEGCTSSMSYSALLEGPHTFEVRATDAAGNTSDTTSTPFTVDINPPTLGWTSPTPDGRYGDAKYVAGCDTPVIGDVCGTAWDAGSGVSKVEIAMRQDWAGPLWLTGGTPGQGGTFSSLDTVWNMASGTTLWSYQLDAAKFPAEGPYLIWVRVTDGVGRVTSSWISWTIDRTAPPLPTITAPGTTGPNPSISFTGEADATFECRLDNLGWTTNCSSPKSYSGLLNGSSHTFSVRATDLAGNLGPTRTSPSWTVDASGPTIGFTRPVAGTPRYTTVAAYNAGCGTASTGDLCETTADTFSTVSTVKVNVRRQSTGLYLMGGTFTSASPNFTLATGTTPSWNYLLAAATFPTDDKYTMDVEATDSVGNVSTASTAWVIDKAVPSGTGVSTTNVGGTARKFETGDTFTLTYSEPINPTSIIGGWDGLTTENVVVHAGNDDAPNSMDQLTIYSANNGALLPLGSLSLRRSDYVTGALTFGLAGSANLSTLTMNGSSLTITLGTPSVPASVTTAGAAAIMRWTPAAGTRGLYDPVTATLTTAYNEIDTDDDF